MKLYIGNRNYSSWSMRAGVLLRACGLPYQEERVRFDGFGPDSVFKCTMGALSPTARVPVLVTAHAGVAWDSLSIAEVLAEDPRCTHVIWPADAAQRSLARGLCAEMHAGFGVLRSQCPMNIEADLAEVGALLWRDRADLRADVARLIALWRHALQRSGGPLLMGTFSAADAFYAPVCTRLLTYALPLPEDIAAYVQHVVALPAVADWCKAARTEDDFLPFEEPYRLGR